MLNYLGPNMGATPVARSLPPSTPGTMPSGVPGVTSTAPPPGPINPVLPPRPMSISPNLAGAINPANPGAPAPPDDSDPANIQYDTLTQEDGTVVLFLKKSDGTRGPAVKIINVKAPRQAPV